MVRTNGGDLMPLGTCPQCVRKTNRLLDPGGGQAEICKGCGRVWPITPAQTKQEKQKTWARMVRSHKQAVYKQRLQSGEV